MKKGIEHLLSIPKIWHKTDFAGYHSGYITTAIKPTKYGFKIKRFSNYISVQSISYYVYPDGFSKAIVKVDTNYQAKYQFTIYFDQNKQEVKVDGNNTRLELAIWKKKRSEGN